MKYKRNKTVLITGTSSGVGRATAKYFAKNGWNVIAAQRNIVNKGELQKFENVFFVSLDLTDKDSIKNAILESLKSHGQIDVLINNAGRGMHGVFEGVKPNDIEEIFRINVFGLMEITKRVLPHFRENGKGLIVNVSSMGGRVGLPLRSIYNSSKFAVEGFSEVLRYELQPFNIRVKVVEPGFVQTMFHQSLSMIREDSVRMYKEQTDRLFSNEKYKSGKGSTPDAIARTIYKASITRSHKLRYTAGIDAWFLNTLHTILPFRLLSAIIARANV